MTTNLPKKREDDISDLIARQMPAIQLAMSGNTPAKRQQNADRFARVALTTIRNSPSLSKANPWSLLAALMTSASLNLEIDPRGLAYLVPYKGEIQLQIGYKGLKELAYRTGKVRSIYDEVVYKREVDAGNVSVSIGLNRDIRHEIDAMHPELRQDCEENPLVLAYAVAVLEDGSRHFEFVDRGEVEKRRKASPAGKSEVGPWNKWEAEMWKKTAVKKLARALPQSTEYTDFQRAVALDEQADAGKPQDFDLPPVIDAEHAPASAADLNSKLNADNTRQCPNTFDSDGNMVNVLESKCATCDSRAGCPAWGEG